MTVATHNNTKGLVRAFDVRTRQAAVDVQYDSQARRVRQRDLGERIVGHQRQHRRLDADHAWTKSSGLVYLPVEVADVGFLRRPPAGQQSVCRKPGLRRSEDRPAEVAFPDRAPSDLGLRSLLGADSGGHHRQRPGDQSGGAADQAVVPVRVRSRDRQAGLADRGAAGPAKRRAWREDVADAAVSDQAAGLCAQCPSKSPTT